MKKIVLVAVATLALSTGAFAKGANSQTGCGLGSMIIPSNDSALMLALQATTNGTSANQTFGITSGTSNCKKVKLVMNERAAEFVASNMDQLTREIALGQGESVNTLAELMNVDNKEAFASTLQANYNSIYTNDKVEMADVLDNISAL